MVYKTEYVRRIVRYHQEKGLVNLIQEAYDKVKDKEIKPRFLGLSNKGVRLYLSSDIQDMRGEKYFNPKHIENMNLILEKKDNISKELTDNVIGWVLKGDSLGIRLSVWNVEKNEVHYCLDLSSFVDKRYKTNRDTTKILTKKGEVNTQEFLKEFLKIIGMEGVVFSYWMLTKGELSPKERFNIKMGQEKKISINPDKVYSAYNFLMENIYLFSFNLSNFNKLYKSMIDKVSEKEFYEMFKKTIYKDLTLMENIYVITQFSERGLKKREINEFNKFLGLMPGEGIFKKIIYDSALYKKKR